MHIFIHTFIHSFAGDPHCFLIAFCSVEAEGLPSCMGYRDTEPRFELGPAIQQAAALLTELMYVKHLGYAHFDLRRNL
jgi:hypothetical protein